MKEAHFIYLEILIECNDKRCADFASLLTYVAFDILSSIFSKNSYNIYIESKVEIWIQYILIMLLQHQ